MKSSVLTRGTVFATCAGLISGLAVAKPWWSSPVIKYSENTGVGANVDPHYMNKDESDQYLFVPLASANVNTPGQLYSIPSLIAGTSSNDVAPIASGTPSALGGNWKGGAVSDDLKRILTGNGVPTAVTTNASLPVMFAWTKDVTSFAVTNSPSAWGTDGIDFSHTSEHLFSNIYNSGLRNRIVKWTVMNLASNGLGLVTNSVFTTSLSRIRNVSDYFIEGKDLIFYGEGDDALGVSARKVCVYDPGLGTETELVTLYRTNETGVVAADVDVMNVKVGGVGLGQMHLYVQCNDGKLYIYRLAANGKSVDGAAVRIFSVEEMKVLLGVGAAGSLGPSDRIRCLEFTSDEKYAFFIHAPSSGNALLHVVWTRPDELAWWSSPKVKYKENVMTPGPHYMNKDESDQYLFLPSGTTVSAPGYLYSIPALIAAASSNDVAPIASALPSALYGNWKGGAVSDELLRALTGSAGAPSMLNSSLPLTEPWTKNVTVFAITNDPVTVQIDSLDFSHTSQHLYSDYYNSPTKIYKWNVVNLISNGVGLTSNAVYSTTLSRVRTVNAYYIGGKELIYYGEGAVATAGNAKVCVFDSDTETETVLFSTTVSEIPSDIMNVKVGGVGLGQMHLYVQCDSGALRVYELSADGKSVGNLVRSFSSAEMKALLGNVTFTYMRSFEVTNDETFAFLTFHGANALYVLWRVPPKGTVMILVD